MKLHLAIFLMLILLNSAYLNKQTIPLILLLLALKFSSCSNDADFKEKKHENRISKYRTLTQKKYKIRQSSVGRDLHYDLCKWLYHVNK